jgi:hypothetical protein
VRVRHPALSFKQQAAECSARLAPAHSKHAVFGNVQAATKTAA